MENFENSFERKLIYVFALNYETHKGLLKIGETTLKTSLPPEKLLTNCEILKKAAKDRIKEYTNTAGVSGAVKILHTELADDFSDKDVHRILFNSNIEQISPTNSTGREWFKVSLPQAVAAIKAAREKRSNISGIKLEKIFVPVQFRPEQADAISKTVNAFQNGKEFLWNAKMRFGKTLCALEVVRQMNFAKTIIVTHRPVVNKSWFDDFKKIFGNVENFIYGAKNQGAKLYRMLRLQKNFVYFASMQDLRGSKTVGGNFTKNADIFSTDWDFVIVDEAHEGTKTALGDKVIKNLVKENTKFLALSGTPFNILEDYSDNVFTWDYVQEQRAKKLFYKNNFGDHNPYAVLPQMKIYTYNLGEILKNNSYFDIEDKAFSFREFFRTKENSFVHEKDINSFLNLLAAKNQANSYPYSTEEYRNYFRHSLWILPGVKAARALSQLLNAHDVFKNFKIVNVAGDGDGEVKNALQQVQNAIKNFNYTITLSCGRLTTGVTVPEWTAVFMLAGSFSTSAASYLQTIFRVQSPCTFGDKIKKFCYVFDFAPDRTLKMIAESVKISSQAGKTTNDDREILGEFLNFCPVISVKGSEMKNFDTDFLFQQLKRAYVERTVKNGFADNYLYSDELFKLDDADLKNFDKLKGIIGSSKIKMPTDVEINNQGLTDEQHEQLNKKARRKLTDAEKELQKQKLNRRKAILILRGISVRLPLLIYGADIPLDDDFKIEMFLDDKIVDDASWLEFMPKGVDRKFFKQFIKFYDKDVFVAAARKIRNIAKGADNKSPTERVMQIAELFSWFKNPDKETVLTPFKVVNLHLTSTFGGWNFFAENPPQFVESEIFSNTKAKILEINSKTGLYPLLIAYNFYRARLGDFSEDELTPEAQQRRWKETLSENIFVLCKTPMAEKISRRTLAGFTNADVNVKYVKDIISQLKNNPENFVRKLQTENFWQKGKSKLIFDAVIGNPPYQIETDGKSNFAPSVYQDFLEASWKISYKASLIHPARCLFNAGATSDNFNKKILNDEHLKIIKYFPDSDKIFPNTAIEGGIAITFRDIEKIFGKIDTFTPFPELNSIHKKVVLENKNFSPLSDIVFSQTIYRLTKKFHEDNPDAIKIISKGHQNDFSTVIMDRFSNLFFDEKPDDGEKYVEVLGRQNKDRVKKFFRADYVTHPESLEKFKVYISTANGAAGKITEGKSNFIIGVPKIAFPNVATTETFITVGAFENLQEAQAAEKFIKTKFCRTMLGILKVTKHNTPEKWSKVPLQDFTSASDIDWSKSVAEIDLQLYKKYSLSAEEINFIESTIKPMN